MHVYAVTPAPANDSKNKGGAMCPACIENTALMVAGAGSMGGVLALYIGKFRRLFRASSLGLFNKTKEK